MDAIYACGYGFHDGNSESVQKVATVFKMSTEGYLYFMKSWGSPVLDDTDGRSSDMCRSVTYDEANNQIVFLMEVISQELRPDFESVLDYSYQNADLLVVLMEPDGKLKEAVNLNFGNAAITFGVAEHALTLRGDHLLFGGQTYGFRTRFQNMTYEPSAPYTDAHIFNLDLSLANGCFYSRTFDRIGIDDVTYEYGRDGPEIYARVPPMPEDSEATADICSDNDDWPETMVMNGQTVSNPCPNTNALISAAESVYTLADGTGAWDRANYPHIARPSFGGNLEDWYTKYNDDEIRGASP
jgi:hypothetical protein